MSAKKTSTNLAVESGMHHIHEMPFGPVFAVDGKVEFRLWAPTAKKVELLLYDGDKKPQLMKGTADGWHKLELSQIKPDSKYHFIIDGDLKVPDPASRYQPEDVHGPSQLVDPRKYRWQETDWRGRPWEEAVIYELHVGTYTREGTFEALIGKLDHLEELGITAIELMPVSDFPGKFNWGYDGVLPFAPDASYGTPDDLKAFIDAAHQRGIMVFLDVVYNHFGPEGNYLYVYAKKFFNAQRKTPWGEAINYELDGKELVRSYVVNNVLYWLTEFQFDGLRFDAVDTIVDSSNPHILEEIASAVRTGPGLDRHVHLILESVANDSDLLWVEPKKTVDSNQKTIDYIDEDTESINLDKYDAQWNDDMHHAMHVLVTGESSGYYRDYTQDDSGVSALEHLGRCLAEGFAYQGEQSVNRGGMRGKPSKHVPTTAFVNFLQNHDQVGNRAMGDRITDVAEPDAILSMAAVYILAPSIPMVFAGEEWAASTTAPWFADFGTDLAKSVREGRLKEFSTFDDFKDPHKLKQIPDPCSEKTFLASKLDWDELSDELRREWFEYYRRLIALRKLAIVPLINKIKLEERSWRILDEGLLLVKWPLEGEEARELALLANLTDQGAPSPVFLASEFDEHNILFQTPQSAANEMALGTVPPWTVVWLLTESAIEVDEI